MKSKPPVGLRYTRNGAFWMGKERILETKDGLPVMGENGIITLAKDEVTIDRLGRVWQKDPGPNDPELVDTIKIVDFDRIRFLKKEGSSFWSANSLSGEATDMTGTGRPGVLQGFLEGSNVNPVKEMVNMIEVNRAYEANQKAIGTQNNLLGKLINQIARY